MSGVELKLHRPPRFKQRLENFGLRQVVPRDVTDDTDVLFRKYPDLAGDRGAIGVGDFDGHCQSWQGDIGWWRRLPEMPQK